MPRIPSLARCVPVRALLAIACAWIVTLAAGATAAQAIIVDPTATGSSTTYDPGHHTSYDGVALTQAPSMRLNLQSAGVPTVLSTGDCTDPALPHDLGGPLLPLPSTNLLSGLCAHPPYGPVVSGSVMHRNETFALTWDPNGLYWAGTRKYVEQFLRNVADSSNQLGSPFALTPQYGDAGGAAQNVSIFGGGCIDLGPNSGSSCVLNGTNTTNPGTTYPSSGSGHCTLSSSALGINQFFETGNGSYDTQDFSNVYCLTDAAIQAEVKGEASSLLDHTTAGYTPLVVVLTPPSVVDCLTAQGTLCSANASQANNAALFCSYHGETTVSYHGAATPIDYVVQPWTAGWTQRTNCDDGGLPQIPTSESVTALATDVGERLVSPISQSELAAITDPGFTGWFSNDGSEIDDNGCTGLPGGLDTATLGHTQYYLQRTFNNAGLLRNDPNSLVCEGAVDLQATFVAPSAVNVGDVMQLDGSGSATTLDVAPSKYVWTFGDGATATGPSVVHSFATAGIYTVTLQVTDRGGNTSTASTTVQVLQANGQPAAGNPVPPQQGGPIPGAGGPVATGTSTTPTPGAPTATVPTTTVPPGTPEPAALTLHVQLLPQSLKGLLANGMAVRVASTAAADGLVTMAIPRAAALKAHLAAGRGPQVVIGRGTLGGRIEAGTVVLRLRLTSATARKLRRLGHLKVTVSLQLVSASGHRETIDVAGQF